MATNYLEAVKAKQELIQRSKQISKEIESVQSEIDSRVELLYDVEETASEEERNGLMDECEAYEAKREELVSTQEELETELTRIKEEMRTAGRGEKVEKKNETPEVMNTRDALNAYFECRDKNMEMVRAAGLVSDDAEVLIPMEIVYQPRDEVYTEQDLDQYINSVSVGTPTGKYPILLRTQEKMHTVDELAENPRLANPSFKEVLWEVDTYRGYIPISQEALDDTAVDLTSLVARHILRIVLNTTNALVSPLIKSFKPAIAKSLDDLKQLNDTMLDPAYQRQFYMSRSMYHYLNTLKDSDGNYVLQPDVTSPSGTSLFGINIVRINDNLIGDYNGQLVCFFGDMKAAITKFNRKQIAAQWADNDIYGTKIQSGFRAGYKVCDEKAGYYVIFAPVEKDLVIKTSDEQTPETVEGVSAEIAIKDNVATITYTGLTDQAITYSLKDAKGAVVASMVGRFTVEKTDDTITVTFAQDMVKGDYTLEAKVLDNKKYKCIKSVKLNIKQKSDEIAKTLNGSPVLISGK